MEKFLESLRKYLKKEHKDFEKRENEASRKMKTYLRLQSDDSSEVKRLEGLIGQKSLYENGDRRADDLILLNNLTALAEYVNVHRALIDRIDTELEESGIRELVKDIKSIKELVEKIKQLKDHAKTANMVAKKRQQILKAKPTYIV